jgi:hypothetical protein
VPKLSIQDVLTRQKCLLLVSYWPCVSIPLTRVHVRRLFHVMREVGWSVADYGGDPPLHPTLTAPISSVTYFPFSIRWLTDSCSSTFFVLHTVQNELIFCLLEDIYFCMRFRTVHYFICKLLLIFIIHLAIRLIANYCLTSYDLVFNVHMFISSFCNM